jgi:DNA-binding PadR family transcriptional regulator
MSSNDISLFGISTGGFFLCRSIPHPIFRSTFYILLSLAPGTKHGYAILKDVEALSKGEISLSTSTLYSALGRLLDRGLIERVAGDPEPGPHPGLPRKAYVLSELGRRILEAETDRMQTLASIARLRLTEEGI